MPDRELDRYIDSRAGELLRDVARLVRIDSAKGEALPGKPFGSGPAAALAEAEALLGEAGMAVKNYGNYVVTGDYGPPDAPGLDILAHLDVVPPGSGWSVTRPFEPLERDGRIYGRGTADDKGPAIAALYAAKAVRALGAPLKKRLRLVLGSDEESGSQDIRHYYSMEKEAPMTFSPDSAFPVVSTEKGGFSLNVRARWDGAASAGDAKGAGGAVFIKEAAGGSRGNIVPGEAHALIRGLSKAEAAPFAEAAQAETGVSYALSESGGLLRIDAVGAGAHSAEPESGNNANTGLLRLLAALPLAEGAASASAKLKAMCALFPHGDWSGRAAGIAMGDELSGSLTISLNILKIDETGFDALFNSRCPICATEENVLAPLRERVEAAGLIFPDDAKMRPPHHVPRDAPFIRTLLDCYEDYTGAKGCCQHSGGGTYVHSLKNGVAFGAAFPGTDNRMHGADEFAVTGELLTAAKIFASAIRRLCC
ncbi:MAG: Sapep family Mn(2+)-dependent dipeptidase [Clostridiales bacterium]|jgi:succinyl-diaminopimelate desuccinylase|nr:Sapep family Mn(2+)-dependent dipeptidase [Clostridiales bacterium]